MADKATIAFHWDMVTSESPHLSMDQMIDRIAQQAGCTVAEVADHMEDRLHEIETRGKKKRRAQLAL